MVLFRPRTGILCVDGNHITLHSWHLHRRMEDMATWLAKPVLCSVLDEIICSVRFECFRGAVE